MDTTTSLKPKPLAELLPYLSGIVSKDAMQTLTARKQPRPTITQTCTAVKTMKPLTMAELMAGIPALRNQSPRRQTQASTSVKKKIWNSSVKVECKKISHTAEGKMKHNPVRKVLNFQPKPRNTLAPRMATANAETPKFPKPEYKAKKSVHILEKNKVRISGICNIPETPVLAPPVRHRMTMANKENLPNIPRQLKNIATPKLASPKIAPKKFATPKMPDTPLSNQSWQSSCDASFLQKEKEIRDIEDKIKNVSQEKTLERIAEVSPPASTPFREYRNVKEYFNNSSEMDTSAVNDNTIMCFDKTFQPEENNKREESVITSLCEMLNKAAVTIPENNNKELHDLLEVEKRTLANIKILDKIREQELKSLEYVRKLIIEKRKAQTISEVKREEKVESIIETKAPGDLKIEKTNSEENPVVGRTSVIKSCIKSPSYKIPKKNACLRKKVFYKSMPNVSNVVLSPNRDLNDKALSVYMNMKKHMNFLSTPVVKERKTAVPDTPSITSHNLQKQLDKLYDDD
ncbi:hypothetical protein O3G_MSEX006085 [Manduca sexta]|uniref:Uncharacterized protein n=1 Tax=Manduca sexta TaxID=7130 RepID=A0A921Z3A2_MANSE|nr:hypothetical protein O3G_MSEX006085 [Manduca sexta]KAG6449439.1 hypothetical protein O3G_MSEX006085 [Manduca sexta]